MTDHDTSMHTAFDRMQRVQHLSRDLPQEPRNLDFTTRSVPNQASIDSPNDGARTTPFEQAASTNGPPPRMVNNYKVVSVLGRGGMGMVFKATDPRLNRTVALKMLLGGAAIDPNLARRFAVEGEALARLDHPNVVPVYEASDWEGVPFYAMKYVPGGTLAENAERLRGDPRKAVAVAAKIARAVGYLHENGISHRDLKPANILLGENDEPMVADFGLAKFLDTDSDLTMTGCLLGTRYYMAPEQTRGHHANLTHACDLWSVGVILYELLTGKLPFKADNYEELFRQIRVSEPSPLTSAAGVAMPELNAVVMRCLAKNPDVRYKSGAELADDLERWLAGEQVQAPAPRKRNLRRMAAIAGTAVAASIVAVFLIAAAVRNEPTPIPDPGISVLIGKTADGVDYNPFAESNPKIGRDQDGHFTLEGQGENVSLIQLAEASYPQGTRIEATVQQLTANSTMSYAGIYCRGRISATPKGRSLNLVGLWASNMTNVLSTPKRHEDYAESRLITSLWNPAVRNRFNLLPLRSFETGIAKSLADGRSVRLRIDIASDNSIVAAVDGKRDEAALTLEEITKKINWTNAHDHTPRIPKEQQFGNGIGLIVDQCKAAFWDVTAQPLPKP